MKKELKITALLLYGLFAVSCSSDEEPINTSSNQEAIIGRWEYESIKANPAVDINGDGEANTDLLSLLNQEINPCLKDNDYIFSEFDILYIDEQANSCDDNNTDPYGIVQEEPYSLNPDQNIVSFGNTVWTIVNITKTKMVIKYNDVYSNVNTTITIAFKRK